MPIGSNDAVAISRRDVNNASTGGAGVLLYGTTANTTNVTQATSRTTGVTINAAVGTITLFNVAGAATAAQFTVTNSFVEAKDVVVASIGTATDPRYVYVTATAAGSFNVNTATLGGITVEAPVINFVVIKGAVV